MKFYRNKWAFPFLNDIVTVLNDILQSWTSEQYFCIGQFQSAMLTLLTHDLGFGKFCSINETCYLWKELA